MDELNLFDLLADNNEEPAGHSESHFHFLNSSSRPDIHQVKERLQAWFSVFPPEHQYELRKRFRSNNDPHNQSAFLELFLYSVFSKLNFEIEIHPVLPSSTRSPDFLLSSNGTQLLVEAVVAFCKTDEEKKAQLRTNGTIDVLNRCVNSPDFFLTVTVHGNPKSSPPAVKFSRQINDYLKLCDYESIRNLYSNQEFGKLPKWSFYHDGLSLKVTPIPKFSVRGQSGIRPIGSIVSGYSPSRITKSIREVLNKKGNRYGDLPLPYIVAVNVYDSTDEDDLFDALFGDVQYRILGDEKEENPTVHHSRIKNGVWGNSHSPRYSRISAVLFITHFRPWSLMNTEMILVKNPWAKRPLKSSLEGISTAWFEDGILHKVGGKPISEILELSDDVPSDG